MDDDGWRHVSSAPRNGSLCEVRGQGGPFGLTSWVGQALWVGAAGWVCSWGAPLAREGLFPREWRPIRIATEMDPSDSP